MEQRLRQIDKHFEDGQNGKGANGAAKSKYILISPQTGLDAVCEKFLDDMKKTGFSYVESVIQSPQGTVIKVQGKEVINFTGNNYLGFSSHPRVVKAAQDIMNERGYGMAATR